MQTNTRHLPATAPVHPNILSGSQHPRSPYNSSQDTPKTSCPRTLQDKASVPRQYKARHLPKTICPRTIHGYNSSPGHSPKTTRSRNTGQDSLLRQLVPRQHPAGLSKIIRLKTYRQDIWCFRTIGPRTGIITQLVPRHINKIYGVPRQQDNRSQDRNHYIQKGSSIVSMQY